jgi:hypothetical protein
MYLVLYSQYNYSYSYATPPRAVLECKYCTAGRCMYCKAKYSGAGVLQYLVPVAVCHRTLLVHLYSDYLSLYTTLA